MREYEIMFILPAEADESLVTTAVDRVTKVVAADGGEVTAIDRWGRRRFAFEVDRQTEGYYVVINVTAQPTAQTELERVLNLADEVMRFKVLVLPEQREGSRQKRRERKNEENDAQREKKKDATPSPVPAETA